MVYVDGSGLTVITLEVEEEQFAALVTVTVYVVVAPGATVMLCVLAPVLQR
jgi:hypothetical protein